MVWVSPPCPSLGFPENKHRVDLISFSIRTKCLRREGCDFCSVFFSTAPRWTDLFPRIPTALILFHLYLARGRYSESLTGLVRTLGVRPLRRRITPNECHCIPVTCPGHGEHETVDKGILTPSLRQMFATRTIKTY